MKYIRLDGGCFCLVWLGPIYLWARVCARPDLSPFVCSMSAGPSLQQHCGALWNFVELCGTLWNFVELCGTLWSSVACTDARRTETVNKAARLDHSAPNQCSITDFIESNMINDVYTLLSICSLRLQTLTPLLGRPFSSDIEQALLNQAS